MTFSKIFAIFGLITIPVINSLILFALSRQLLIAIWHMLMLMLMPNLAIFIGKIGFGYTGIIWIVITVVCMISDALLLIGISKKKPSLLIPWLVIRMILLVVC